MKLVRSHRFNPGDGKPVSHEERVGEVKFHIHKFNNRRRPADKKRILIITCFSEFGCESIALMYLIPKVIQRYSGAYIICAGWFGREYLYRHLADEYWELDEEFQWLREYSMAFKHTSRNLDKIEKGLEQHGQVFKGALMGYYCLGNTCRRCGYFFSSEQHDDCPKCMSEDVDRGLLADIPHWRRFAVQVPRPSLKMQAEAKKYLKPNPVGIFARGRVCYGRNLRPEFYVKLIDRLEQQGYNLIWLGEKQSVLPCPVDHITDFSRLPESRNLELTLAIVSQLEFTVQFWTASTRFASMMGVPWILFESPDQIAGQGQEGKRIALTTDHNKKKLVIAQYLNVMEDEGKALDLVEQAVREMKADNWEDIIGMVDQPDIIKNMLACQQVWRG
jgi:predicted Zn-ribbon and HTH transcriptional regulator